MLPTVDFRPSNLCCLCNVVRVAPSDVDDRIVCYTAKNNFKCLPPNTALSAADKEKVAHEYYYYLKAKFGFVAAKLAWINLGLHLEAFPPLTVHAFIRGQSIAEAHQNSKLVKGADRALFGVYIKALYYFDKNYFNLFCRILRIEDGTYLTASQGKQIEDLARKFNSFLIELRKLRFSEIYFSAKPSNAYLSDGCRTVSIGEKHVPFRLEDLQKSVICRMGDQFDPATALTIAEFASRSTKGVVTSKVELRNRVAWEILNRQLLPLEPSSVFVRPAYVFHCLSKQFDHVPQRVIAEYLGSYNSEDLQALVKHSSWKIISTDSVRRFYECFLSGLKIN